MRLVKIASATAAAGRKGDHTLGKLLGNESIGEGGDTSKPSSAIQLTDKQRDLQSRLAKTIREAIPVETDLDKVQQRAQGCYRMIAELLVDLRHEFPGPNGESHDLQGRSSSYRAAVREAYAKAGAEIDRPIPKRLTAGVAYWVKKILVVRYGEKALYENGTIRRMIVKTGRCSDASANMIDGLPQEPAVRLDILVGMLNTLAVDPRLNPSQEAVRSALRAVLLLQKKLSNSDARLKESWETALALH
jgi:hypothetical protein